MKMGQKSYAITPIIGHFWNRKVLRRNYTQKDMCLLVFAPVCAKDVALNGDSVSLARSFQSRGR